MPKRDELVQFLNERLNIDAYCDTSLNGLQVEGADEVKQVAAAVDGSLATVRKACHAGADFIVVHHGLLWAKSFPITGPKKAVIKTLLDSNTSLYAAHLPLDGDPEVGNNFSLARLLHMQNLKPCFDYQGSTIGACGDNIEGFTLAEISKKLQALPGAATGLKKLEFGPETPKRIGIVSGAGADALHDCAAHDIDTLITGEPRHFAYHLAREEKLNVVFAGHYATETVGVMEAARALEAEFSVPWTFIDIPTGI